MGIPAPQDVLEAAGTKWNFLKFTPGLVGGHCIGVDPYYLTMKAGENSAICPRGHPRRPPRQQRTSLVAFIAQKTVEVPDARWTCRCAEAKVGILGLTFKENVPDLPQLEDPRHRRRSSPTFGIEAMVYDPLGDPHEAHEEYKLDLAPLDKFNGLERRDPRGRAQGVHLRASTRSTRASAIRRRRDRRQERAADLKAPPRGIRRVEASKQGHDEVRRRLRRSRELPAPLAGDRRGRIHRLGACSSTCSISGQTVVGVDSFLTGHKKQPRRRPHDQPRRAPAVCHFIEGDLHDAAGREAGVCKRGRHRAPRRPRSARCPVRSRIRSQRTRTTSTRS